MIFFETAAVGHLSIEGGNPTRTESIEEAIEIDRRLQQVWGQHSNFNFIPHESSFLKKLEVAVEKLKSFLDVVIAGRHTRWVKSPN